MVAEIKKTQEIEVASVKSANLPDRATWDRPLEFILSCVGYAVGLGNVWRFPYLCYRNGGGAFLLPYILMIFTLGLPIFFLEMVVGQYSRLGPNEAFERMAPIFHGLGYCTLVVITFITIYYMVIIAWTIFYVFASFSSTLGWSSCDNFYNTKSCYSNIKDQECQSQSNSSDIYVFYSFNCTKMADICEENGFGYEPEIGKNCFNATINEIVPLSKVITRILASEEYYMGYVLGLKEGIDWYNFGSLRWQLVLCLLLAWIIAFFCVLKGVQSAGKAVYFTALFPYVILIALFIRGVTLKGAKTGITFYISPDWNKLTEAGVWGDAASQIFYAFGIGCGSLVTLASYSRFDNNCMRDAVIVSATNGFTSLFAGFSIFAILGFMAENMDVPIDQVVDSGPGLAFVAYPEALLGMPLPQLWAILFFFMLFVLGIGSQLGGIEAMNTAAIDKWPILREHRIKVNLFTCTLCFLAGLPMCFEGGVLLFTLMDSNTASWAIMLIGLAEIGCVAWVYGCSRFLDNIEDMQMKLGRFIRSYWWIVWSVIAPIILVGICTFTMVQYSPARFGKFYFPIWADTMGILISVATIIPLPIFALYRIILRKPGGSALFQPSKLWGPAQDDVSDSSKSPLDLHTQGKATDGKDTHVPLAVHI